jgi:hypothetical protein
MSEHVWTTFGLGCTLALCTESARVALVEDVHVAQGPTAPRWTVTVSGDEAARMPGIAGFPAMPRKAQVASRPTGGRR